MISECESKAHLVQANCVFTRFPPSTLHRIRVDLLKSPKKAWNKVT